MITTEEVRRAYQVYKDPHEDLSGMTKFYAGKEFDAWLREEKAKPWDEGFDEASDDLGRAQMMADMGESTNPYREEEQ